MSFFRQTALLLPSAFLLAVLLFLLTHGREDPALGAYPFLQQWAGGALAVSPPEVRFVEQACLFFLPAYAVTLLFLLCVALAESALFGARRENRRSPYRRTFGVVFPVLFLAASAAAVWAGDRVAERLVPGALVAPLLVAGRAAPGRCRPVGGGGRRRAPCGAARAASRRDPAGRSHMSASRAIVVLDFGSQYTQLIARRVREARVFSVVLPPTASSEEIRRANPVGIILSGGPQSVYEADAPRPAADPAAFGVPVLGVCYGMQWMAKAWGGEVAGADGREYGRAAARVEPDSKLFAGLEPEQTVWMSHGDSILSPPPGFRVAAETASSPIAAFEDPERNLYAVCFHPEVRHTEHGTAILQNFLFGICGAKPEWTMAGFRQEKVAEIRRQAPQGSVVCALSGGVDSSVTAVLLREALGGRVHPILVDHGLMRAHETRQVVEAFSRLGIAIDAVDASDLFLSRLSGVEDPEEKRRIIGRTFIEVFEREAKKIPDARYLAQGTLYPDRIESISIKGPSVVIKTHHNVGGLPEKLGLELIEPVRDLFKDEVRLLGAELRLPREFLARHPFPGPGLAVRIPGEVTREKIAILQKADEIVLDEIRAAGLYDAISQAFAVLLPVRSVGVMGDSRTHEFVLSVRAVQTTDFMTADWFRMPHEILDSIARRVVQSVRGINRVLYDVTSKPPATIEWE